MVVNYRYWAVLYGLYIWVQATLTIRWFGDAIFRPGEPFYMAFVFVVTIGLVYGAGWFFYRMFKLNGLDRAIAGIVICAAICFANIPALLNTSWFFPDIKAGQLPWLAAWDLWGIGVGILTGILPNNLPGMSQGQWR